MRKPTQRKPTQRLLLGLMMIFFLAFAAQAANNEGYIYIRFDDANQRFNLTVIEKNIYYQPYFLRGSLSGNVDYMVSFFDQNSNLINNVEYYRKANNLYRFNPGIAKIVVKEDSQTIIEKDISFCNNNGICEPCEGYDCTLIENTITCPDCPTGSSDYFCDLVQDNICDPDCNNHDKDCKDCKENCWYRDSVIPITRCVEDKGGKICDPGQQCTGEYIYADDSGSLCCNKGRCISETLPEPPGQGNISTPGEKPTPPANNEPPALLILLGIMAIALLIIVVILLAKKH